jgi:hypothetical protein
MMLFSASGAVGAVGSAVGSAVAEGLIQPWCVSAAGRAGQGREDIDGREELRKNGTGKRAERTGSIHSSPWAMQSSRMCGRLWR